MSTSKASVNALDHASLFQHAFQSA